jgi:hypothetical protein
LLRLRAVLDEPLPYPDGALLKLNRICSHSTVIGEALNYSGFFA